MRKTESKGEKEMRNRNVLYCVVLVAAAGLLAAPAAMATGGSCSSFNPTVTVVAGPCPVSSASPTACAASGPFTGIKYKITNGSPDHAATVVTANNTPQAPPGFQAYPACDGDPVTGLGKHSCHEKALKVNPNAAAAGQFWVVVAGQKTAVPQSIALKKGFCVKSYAVVGLGFDVNPYQAAQKVETINFKGCAVKFVYDVVSGAVLSAVLDPDESSKPVCAVGQNDGTCCAFYGDDVTNLELTLNGQSLGTGKFGEGYVSSGTDSCTTRVIGGKVYTWGSPCPSTP